MEGIFTSKSKKKKEKEKEKEQEKAKSILMGKSNYNKSANVPT